MLLLLSVFLSGPANQLNQLIQKWAELQLHLAQKPDCSENCSKRVKLGIMSRYEKERLVSQSTPLGGCARMCESLQAFARITSPKISLAVRGPLKLFQVYVPPTFRASVS